VLFRSDLPHAREALPAFLATMEKRKIRVLELSGATGEGLERLLDACARELFSQASAKTRAKQLDQPRDVVTAETAFRAPRAPKAVSAKKATAKKATAKKATAKKPVAKKAVAKKKPAKKRSRS
jgi:hypothetical protein